MDKNHLGVTSFLVWDSAAHCTEILAVWVYLRELPLPFMTHSQRMTSLWEGALFCKGSRILEREKHIHHSKLLWRSAIVSLQQPTLLLRQSCLTSQQQLSALQSYWKSGQNQTAGKPAACSLSFHMSLHPHYSKGLYVILRWLLRQANYCGLGSYYSSLLKSVQWCNSRVILMRVEHKMYLGWHYWTASHQITISI